MRALAASLLMASLTVSCIPSNVVAVEDRAVRLADEDVVWAPGTTTDLQGMWVAHSIEGEAAESLLSLVYWFGEDGHFTGAALFDDVPPRFEVLQGMWSMDQDGLRLGENAPTARFEAARDLIRLGGEGGTIVLHRNPLR